MTALFKDPILLAVALGSGLPLLSMAIIFLFTRHKPKLSSYVSIGSIATSFVCAWYLLAKLYSAGGPVQYQVPWLFADDIFIPFGYLLDPLSLIMLAIVATISFLVQIYSMGYMAGDPGYSRYYACHSLFAFAMMNMVIAPTMIQLFIFWELVGLASYLLIGFYYEKYSASQAGKKAFVMTRFADVGFFLGLIILLLGFGNLAILDINEAARSHAIHPLLVTTSAILIFCGVIGKSAQFPLLTWLPDAMEGPTPVSALLHSATMVAAGVYMFSRIFPFFAVSPDAMAWALAIGTITMLLSSTMAMVTFDLKQVWAYSTVSQLGFMVMSLAAGGYFAGVFHLTTHAGFKALLFLCSGIFIHEYHTNDMRIIGRMGGRKLRIPMVCMTIGALALSGIFPFSGFFSKEAVLGVLASHPNKIWLYAGLLGAMMTAYYTFRLIFFILFPKGGVEEAAQHHEAAHGHGSAHGHEDDQGHEDHGGEHHGFLFWAMAIPVMVLASVTLVLGFLQTPIEHFLMGMPAVVDPHHAAAAGEAHGSGHYTLLVAAVSIALSGIFLAWLEFGRKGASQEGFLSKFPKIWELFDKRWYMDSFLRKALDRVVYGGFTNLFTRNDRRVIDGGIDGICYFTVTGGRLFSFLQSGMLQNNLLIMVAAVGLVVLYFLV
jgi:NADH-quinone oxidoreductase subunit L